MGDNRADDARDTAANDGRAGDSGRIGGIGNDGSDPGNDRIRNPSDASQAPMPPPDADAGLQREVGDIDADDPGDGSLPGRMGGGLAGG